MAVTFSPASPAEEIAAWRSEPAPTGTNPLSADQIAFAQSGVSVTIGACQADGLPVGGLANGCRIAPDGTVRVLLLQVRNRQLIEALRQGSAVAVTFTGAPEHRAFQVKAERAEVLAAQPDEAPELDRQAANFIDGLVQLGYPPELAHAYAHFDPEDLIAVELMPDRAFTQTPGPGAGAELKR